MASLKNDICAQKCISTDTISVKDIEAVIAKFNINGYSSKIYGGTLKTDWFAETHTGEEEWIWVTGYKATDKNMQCRDYQFELGKQHDMPEDAPIIMCGSGFHFCDKLKKTFNYYNVQNGNRYFEVKALVRRWKKDGYYITEQSDDKMVAKSIVLTRELSIDEIFKEMISAGEFETWTTEQKELARQTNINHVRKTIKIDDLIKRGYAETFAAYVVDNSAYDIARTMADMPNVSMDVKVLSICMRMFKR